MGMLDRLLGDLVAGSTNLPPHVARHLHIDATDRARLQAELAFETP